MFYIYARYLQFGANSSLSFSGILNTVLAGGFIDIAWNGPLAHAAQQTDWQKIRSVENSFNGMQWLVGMNPHRTDIHKIAPNQIEAKSRNSQST